MTERPPEEDKSLETDITDALSLSREQTLQTRGYALDTMSYTHESSFIPLQYSLYKLGRFTAKYALQSMFAVVVITASSFLCGYFALTLLALLGTFIFCIED